VAQLVAQTLSGNASVSESVGREIVVNTHKNTAKHDPAATVLKHTALLWEQEVARSNRVAPTDKRLGPEGSGLFLWRNPRRKRRSGTLCEAVQRARFCGGSVAAGVQIDLSSSQIVVPEQFLKR
jgi:hypothetical protein